MRVYLSASIVNAPVNTQIAKMLRQAGFIVFLPQSITPKLKPRAAFEASVYNRCVVEMNNSDIGLLVLDSYGRDSAWEAGWYSGLGKPMVGWVQNSFRFAQDWMVKASLRGFLTTNKAVFHAMRRDAILRRRQVCFIRQSQDIRMALQMLAR